MDGWRNRVNIYQAKSGVPFGRYSGIKMKRTRESCLYGKDETKEGNNWRTIK